MSFNELENNMAHMKKIIGEIYSFSTQLDIIKNLETGSKSDISPNEKELLQSAIDSLTTQLKILNNSIPKLVNNINFYKKLGDNNKEDKIDKKLIRVEYDVSEKKDRVTLTINEEDKKAFIKNLTQSNFSINKLKKNYSVKKPLPVFGKPSIYAKISNHFFRNMSNKYLAKGNFGKLNKDLRKMNSPFVIGTYVSMIFFTVFLTFIFSLFLLFLLLFYNIGFTFPFISPTDESIVMRIMKFFWVIFAIPTFIGLFMYIYPSTESKNLGKKIDQELPFLSIHMSAIATSGIEPLSIFKIILRSQEYKYSVIEIRKIMNLVNFHGKDLVTALKETSTSSSSTKMRELLDGIATTITSGGLMREFLDKHSEGLLFDYKLERERYIKISETFMDIYISLAIAAPMIFLMLFVIMGSTGALTNFFGLSVGAISLLMILGIIILNAVFLILLNLKQPTI